MRILVRGLTPGGAYALQFRSVANSPEGVQFSEWSQVQRFTATSDQIPPSTPLNLSWYNSGSAFIAEWSPVTTQATNPATPLLDFRHYRCSVSDGTKTVDFYTTEPRFSLSREANAAAFGSMKSALTITVRAVDMTYNESAPITATVNPNNPPVPNAPVLSNYYGSVLLEYNGRDSGNAPMPANIDYLEVHLGGTNTFTATDATRVERLEMNRTATTQRAILTGLTNGDKYYARLIAVSETGRKSAASSVSNEVTKTNLSGLEIQNNSVSAAQINFTARDIGGANAYYSATQPTGDIYKAGDIWYHTADGYKTYKHNGTGWEPAPEIGVIAGTKILAGTLTADAVGTNLLITAKANIGSAIIDSGHIDTLSANLIKAGILQSSFNVNYGGVSQPAWSLDVNGNATFNNATVNGQLVLGSSSNTAALNTASIAKSYNYVPGSTGWIIRGDGTVEFGSAVLRGSFRTATTGRRIEIVSGGSSGTIRFFAPDGDSTYIRSVTEANAASIEALQLGVGDPAAGSWNKIAINLGHTGHLISRANIIENVAATDYRFFLTQTTLGGVSEVNAARVLEITKAYTNLRDINATSRVFFDTDFGSVRDQNGTSRVFYYRGREADKVVLNGVDGGSFIQFNGDGHWEQHVSNNTYRRFDRSGESWFVFDAGGSIRLTAQSWGQLSPGLVLFNGQGFGNKFQVWQDNRGVWTENKTWNDSGFAGLRASAFEVISDMRTKSDIKSVSTSEMLSMVKSTPIKRYKRDQPNRELKTHIKIRVEKVADSDDSTEIRYVKDVTEESVAVTVTAPEEIGILAQEAPPQIVNVADDGSIMGVDLYQTTIVNWGATQENSKIIEALQAQVKTLESRILALEAPGKGAKK